MCVFSGINRHVMFEIASICKSLVTQITFERFVSSVNHHVLFEIARVLQTLQTIVTQITFERLVSSVNQHVLIILRSQERVNPLSHNLHLNGLSPA